MLYVSHWTATCNNRAFLSVWCVNVCHMACGQDRLAVCHSMTNQCICDSGVAVLYLFYCQHAVLGPWFVRSPRHFWYGCVRVKVVTLSFSQIVCRINNWKSFFFFFFFFLPSYGQWKPKLSRHIPPKAVTFSEWLDWYLVTGWQQPMMNTQKRQRLCADTECYLFGRFVSFFPDTYLILHLGLFKTNTHNGKMGRVDRRGGCS